MILELLDSISNNMANLTSAIGTLIARFDDNSNTAKKTPVSAVTPLDELSSTGIFYSATPGPLDDDNLSVASQLTQATSALSQSLCEIKPRSSSGNIAKRIDPLLYNLDQHVDITEVKAWY